MPRHCSITAKRQILPLPPIPTSLFLGPKVRPNLLHIPLPLTILPTLLMLLTIRRASPRPTRRTGTRRRSMIGATITLHKARRERRRSHGRNGRRLRCRDR
jgi:hypothetical protein